MLRSSEDLETVGTSHRHTLFVIPAEAGIQKAWTPAFAGVTTFAAVLQTRLPSDDDRGSDVVN